jgi:DMSO/TMAO reductase YedYZ molybdopterin-dependent catalytic subunit
MGSRLTWAALGMASAAVAIGVGEVVAGLLGGTSAVAAVGALIISLQPPGAKDFMVSLFGTNDKLALETMVFIGGVLLGSLVGLLGRRDVRLAYGVFIALGVVGFVLILQDPLENIFPALVTIGAAVAAGLAMFMWLGAMLVPAPVPASRKARSSTTVGGSTPDAIARTPPTGPSLPRRGFLVIAGTFVAVGAVLSVIGRVLGSQVPVQPGTPIAVPLPQETVPPLPAGADFGIAGVTPIIVPNTDFYLIDTRLGTPEIDASTWSLHIHGMVNQEVTLTYDQLLAMPLIEQYVTIACVSNEVGGHLVGNAKWTGVNLNSVLALAGVQDGATQVVGRSFDGWTSGFPTAHLSGAGKDAMLVVQMNGEPLPARHGYPVRTIVPGLYGYVSATKWITEIELTTLEAFDAYWVRLGWAKEGPILTQSRIDTPRSEQGLPNGQVQIGGVAWAPTRGISKVEIEMDEDNNWRECQLSVPLSDYTWVQWQTTVGAAPGRHTISVRATDGTGMVQESRSTPPAPDGARGYHTVSFIAN